jgi:hypothetical protein
MCWRWSSVLTRGGGAGEGVENADQSGIEFNETLTSRHKPFSPKATPGGMIVDLLSNSHLRNFIADTVRGQHFHRAQPSFEFPSA